MAHLHVKGWLHPFCWCVQYTCMKCSDKGQHKVNAACSLNLLKNSLHLLLWATTPVSKTCKDSNVDQNCSSASSITIGNENQFQLRIITNGSRNEYHLSLFLWIPLSNPFTLFWMPDISRTSSFHQGHSALCRIKIIFIGRVCVHMQGLWLLTCKLEQWRVSLL